MSADMSTDGTHIRKLFEDPQADAILKFQAVADAKLLTVCSTISIFPSKKTVA